MKVRLRPTVVGDAPTEQQEAAEGEGVGRDDPLQVGGGDLRSALALGIARFTIEASRTIMSWAMAMTASALNRRGSAGGRSWAWTGAAPGAGRRRQRARWIDRGHRDSWGLGTRLARVSDRNGHAFNQLAKGSWCSRTGHPHRTRDPSRRAGPAWVRPGPARAGSRRATSASPGELTRWNDSRSRPARMLATTFAAANRAAASGRTCRLTIAESPAGRPTPARNRLARPTQCACRASGSTDRSRSSDSACPTDECQRGRGIEPPRVAGQPKWRAVEAVPSISARIPARCVRDRPCRCLLGDRHEGRAPRGQQPRSRHTP